MIYCLDTKENAFQIDKLHHKTSINTQIYTVAKDHEKENKSCIA